MRNTVSFPLRIKREKMKRNLWYSATLFAIVLALLQPGCAEAPETTQTEESPGGQGTPPRDERVALYKITSVIPESLLSIDWWAQRFEKLNGLVKKEKYPLIFIGDSITHSWEGDGKKIWAEYYAPRNALNLGFSGDLTEHVLWRLQNGNFEGQEPKVCVLLIGTNNFRANPPSEIAMGIGAIVDEIRKQSPTSKVLILAIFPRFERPDALREGLADASRRASKWADGEHVFYLDIGEAFLDDDGTLPEDVMPDFLHPNEKGYRIWAEAMEPTLRRLLDE